ncbi:nucleotidyltransferase family protein [Brevibacillus sp. LEMMJ03]|jgi:molybdenum cofactor cytidylyltransferase|uniref:nucleotidyltransferase family protein n=1 Tax=Brevibacillus sp. LEMMJ03 TaxID=2595056 RepID=UPI00117D7C0D|nr:nucleotidyltransferase family protein [Brevibacillus sp. LEMMJ03]TRY23616.1 nucleotidyltransferase family protein [Brevibacillus sp. LEMMJ03]
MRRIGAVILAAGMSRRMGVPKLFLEVHGKPLFRHSVECAIQSKLDPILIVGGEHVHLLHEHTRDLSVEIIKNSEYAKGMATSLQRGVEALTGRVDALLVFLADQPFVPPMLVRKLLQTYADWRSHGIQIVRPQYSGIPGHPVLFDAELFSEFSDLKGDEGGRLIISRHAAKLKLIPAEQSLWGADIDTPDDLKKWETSFPPT